jgi:hypothetical protein
MMPLKNHQVTSHISTSSRTSRSTWEVELCEPMMLLKRLVKIGFLEDNNDQLHEYSMNCFIVYDLNRMG